MISQRVLCRRFIGRVAELDYVADCRRRAAALRGGGIIVLGDAGIGKSRLVREYRERYGARSYVATGVCREFGQRAFEPLAEVLYQLGPDSPSPLAVPAASKDEQLATIVAAVDRAASRRMTTIVVEDIHWAQVELLQTLTALSQWAVNHRLLLIFTCRDADVSPSSPRFKALARLSRETSTLRLEPFSPAELSELMLNALEDLDATVPPETFNDVRRRAAGNPFFAEELLRHAVDGRRNVDQRRAPPRLPISLQGVIRERLDRCEPGDRKFLSAASVLGQRFRIDVLSDVFGIERDEAVAALANLIDLQLIDRCDDPLTYEFRHSLARDVVYGDLVPAEAPALHQRVAETVESLPGTSGHTELLAHSFWEAGLLQRAAPYCEAAGDAASEHYAYEDAVTWFERAATAFGDRAPDLGRVLGKASVALNRLSEPKRAVPLYERAIAVLAASGDFDAAVRMSTYLGGTLYNDARSAEALAVFETAGRLAARSGVAQLELHVRLRLFAVLVVSRRLDQAIALAAEIDEAALDPSSRDTFEYHLSKTHLHALRDERDLRRASIGRAFAALERRDGPPYEWRFAHGYVAVDALALGELEEARRHAMHALELARSIRSDVPYMLALLADVEERAGNLRLAREHLAAITPGPEFLHRQMRALAAIRVGVALGDDALTLDAYDAELMREAKRGGNADVFVELAGAFTVALARLNRIPEARALAGRFVAAMVRPYNLAWQIVEVARLFPDTAARLRERIVAGGADPPGPLDAALCAFLDALVARQANDADGAATCARRGAERFGRIGWPMAEARSLELAGELGAALTIYRHLGCSADVRRLEHAHPTGTGSLSPREREVARLVADGKNNRDAALELSISPKSVEKNLTSIYRKLGLASRTQLAGYVVANGVDTFR